MEDWSEVRGDHWRSHLDGFEVMLRPVDTPLLESLALSRATRIADLGCGSGATTRALRWAAPDAEVHGFDISAALLDVARSRSADLHLRFERVDLERAPAPARPYDRLSSRFGLMFFGDPRASFARLREWLTPSGRFAFAVWGPVSDNLWASSVRDVVAELVSVPVEPPDAPSPFRYGDVETLLEELDASGFTRLAAREWRGALPMGTSTTPLAAARFALTAFSSMAAALDCTSASTQAEAERRLASRWEAHSWAGVTALPACVHIVTGEASA
ncbi:MAG: class I SAM-dependent methyltransferase [Myxococcota bacterium]